MISETTTQLHHCGATGYKKFVKAWLYSHTTLFKDTEIWILCYEIEFFFWFFSSIQKLLQLS